MKIVKVIKIVALIFLSVIFVRAIQVDVIEKGRPDFITFLILLFMLAGIIGLIYSLYRDYKKKLQEQNTVDNQEEKYTYITSDGVLVNDNDKDGIIIYRPTGRFMTPEDAKLADNKELPVIKQNDLILKSDEFCCFIGDGKTYKSKTVTTGYVSNHRGGSVRIMRGLSYHTGGSTSQAIRQTQTTIFNGTIYITNKRIVYVSHNGEGFDKTIDKISSVNELEDGIMIQIGSKTYTIELEAHVLFMQIFNLVKNKEFGTELPEILLNPNVQYTTDSKVLNMINGKEKRNKSNSKSGTIALLTCLAIFISLIVIVNTIPDKRKDINVNVDDPVMLAQFVNIGFSNEQAQKAVNIIRKIGINEITSMEQRENDTRTIGYYDTYPTQEQANIVYECTGKDGTKYKCVFLVFIKDNEIIHVSYYGYGDKTPYYTKEKGILRKPVHPYVDN